MPRRKFEFRYGMRLRGFSPGAQPRGKFLRHENDPTGQYYDILVYARRLTDAEVVEYDLDDLNSKPAKKLTKYREMAGIRQSTLSNLTFIPLRSIQRLEMVGMNKCALDTAILIADTLHCDVRDLMEPAEPRQP